MEIQIDTQGGSAGGISMLGEGLVQVGMSSRPIDDDDRATYPKLHFKEITIGEDAVALIVSKDVWEGGVHALSKDQIQKIYEGKITNWADVGGKSQRIVFFNRESGRGTWVTFANWLYGSSKKAPKVNLLEVGGDDEALTKVVSTRGAVTQLTSVRADGKRSFALGIKELGNVVDPAVANIASHRYPIFRQLNLLTDGEPSGEVKTLVDFMLSERGQDLVQKCGYLRLADLTYKR